MHHADLSNLTDEAAESNMLHDHETDTLESNLVRFPQHLIVRESVSGQDSTTELEDMLLGDVKFDVNYLNEFGHTVLATAAFVGNIKCCKLLVHLGAEVSKRDSDGWTAMHYAAAKGYLDVAKFLVMCGGDVNALNSDGESPLEYVEDEELKKRLLGYYEKCSESKTEV